MTRTISRDTLASVPQSPPEPLPITPEMASALDGGLARYVRCIRIILGSAGVTCAATGTVVTVFSPHDAGLGLFVFAFGPLLIWYARFVNRRVTRSVRSGLFYRAEGSVWIEGGDVPLLHVGAGKMGSSRSIRRAVKGMSYGAADYTQRGEIVIEIRDASGAVRYRMPGYTPYHDGESGLTAS